ncbi:MAG: riboflavin synthase [Planctomycetota bacterium]|jgi:riboflavin synthase
MFTGLIEKICTVKSVHQSADSMLLTIDLGELADDSRIGDSIAINGACLTIARLQGGLAGFELSAETLAKSALGKLRPLSEVNVERAIKATDRFGGHFVQGHIDGTGTITTIDRHGEFADMKFAAEVDLLDAMVVKGSVAVDGISLTIAGIDQSSFSVAIIPETMKKTTLDKAKIGDCVNIETDIIVKTVKKQLEKILPKKQPLTAEKLKQLGF